MESSLDVDGVRMIVCKFCGFKSKYATNVRTHIEGKQTEGMAYYCGTCDYKVNTWQTLLQHMKRTHDITKQNYQKYQC